MTDSVAKSGNLKEDGKKTHVASRSKSSHLSRSYTIFPRNQIGIYDLPLIQDNMTGKEVENIEHEAESIDLLPWG